MNVLSRYSFIQAYQSDQITKQKAREVGLTSNEISACDTDGDGVLTVDEILANDDVCDKIIAAINAQQNAPAENDEAVAAEAGQNAENENFFGYQFEMAA